MANNRRARSGVTWYLCHKWYKDNNVTLTSQLLHQAAHSKPVYDKRSHHHPCPSLSALAVYDRDVGVRRIQPFVLDSQKLPQSLNSGWVVVWEWDPVEASVKSPSLIPVERSL